MAEGSLLGKDVLVGFLLLFYFFVLYQSLTNERLFVKSNPRCTFLALFKKRVTFGHVETKYFLSSQERMMLEPPVARMTIDQVSSVADMKKFLKEELEFLETDKAVNKYSADMLHVPHHFDNPLVKMLRQHLCTHMFTAFNERSSEIILWCLQLAEEFRELGLDLPIWHSDKSYDYILAGAVMNGYPQNIVSTIVRLGANDSFITDSSYYTLLVRKYLDAGNVVVLKAIFTADCPREYYMGDLDLRSFLLAIIDKKNLSYDALKQYVFRCDDWGAIIRDSVLKTGLKIQALRNPKSIRVIIKQAESDMMNDEELFKSLVNYK